MAEIRGGLAKSIRRLAREGYDVRWIARRHDLDPADVRAFLKTPTKKERTHSPARQIRGPIVPKVLDLCGRGWSPRDIAWALELDPDTVREFFARYEGIRTGSLTRPRTRAEQEALEQRHRERLERLNQPQPAKWVDEWKAAAATGDPAYQDGGETRNLPATAEQPAIAAAELAELDLVNPPAAESETWFTTQSPAKREPHKITPEILAEAEWLHSTGVSWPEIARKYRCHRNAFFHARRRRSQA